MRKVLFFLLLFQPAVAQINRKAVVQRHTVHINKAEALSSLSVGNGNFAFTVDVTGMQSFPEFYAAGVPLGTQSVWGWRSVPDTGHYRFEETLKDYDFNGRKVSYAVQTKSPAVDYFRANPHRLQLGNVAMEITKKDGSLAALEDIRNIDQQLDLWTGEISSRFTVEGDTVKVITVGDQIRDAVAFSITSDLLVQGRLKIRLRVPEPTGEWKDVGVNWEKIGGAKVVESALDGRALKIGNAQHFIQMKSSLPARVQNAKQVVWVIPPRGKHFDIAVGFSSRPVGVSAFSSIRENNKKHWEQFWSSGGAVDFAGSTDPRAFELERRVVLSQYLTKIQCSGGFPPQETGLTYNSWYGKPHLEMHWWHVVHFALWGRPELMERSLDWYFKVAGKAKLLAKRQGYEGLRWQKMTDHEGNEAPSSIGSFLIWQQPHFIYMAEMLYRHDKKALRKYKELLFATADFMASYPVLDPVTKKYNLGKGLIPAQECFDPRTTFNPTYELAYWHWALNIAQQWRVRSGLPKNKKWQEVIDRLAPLPQQNNVYLATESTPDCYTNEGYLKDHPAVLAAYATIPAANGLDTTIMKNTLELVWDKWKWNNTWGWDFPLVAMTAARLHLPEKALDALFMPIRTNTYLLNGHNYQDERLTIYLPGNGGLLSAVAMMCTGTDADATGNIGFPSNGKWKIKWEGLEKMF
ncbi:hypothetical protein GFS24_20495 [Chitinophaga sp. SYP-B3965]|uniref:hypothetical protein n=1 Tax=Chitinophaga sp. SYP-B3965 TaxID=2663120 RepID=UPI0012996F42|nr:hypothetical protein [Chitinophaga sp. SYP-B3965]MRG47513.1 hypothetical protein [Chitinophaga sp. SYP-B3965]